MDRIGEMLEKLEQALPEVAWDRDAVSEDAAVNTGAVELGPAVRTIWADGKMIGQVLRIDVWLCVRDSGPEYLEIVQAVLEEMAEKYDGEFGWAFAGRGYSPNIDDVVWQWRCESDGLSVS